MPAEPVTSSADRLSVLQRSALALLKLYKILLSPLFAGSCRFLPSCSDYAREAVMVHGTVRGSWLAIRRLSRCHPLGSSGFDPVPGGSRRGSGDASPRASQVSGSLSDPLDSVALTRGRP
jgi:putative membrane protein insertion efficiency factor